MAGPFLAETGAIGAGPGISRPGDAPHRHRGRALGYVPGASPDGAFGVRSARNGVARKM